MIYKVVRHFSDLLDGSYKYAEGDVYPREGYTPSEKRIAELASENNKQKTVLIQAVVDDVAESAETVETSAVEETEPTTTITEEIKVVEKEKPKKRSRSKKTEE